MSLIMMAFDKLHLILLVLNAKYIHMSCTILQIFTYLPNLKRSRDTEHTFWGSSSCRSCRPTGHDQSEYQIWNAMHDVIIITVVATCTLPPGRCKYSDWHICMSLSTRVSQKPQSRSKLNKLCLRVHCGCCSVRRRQQCIRYVLPVLWMMRHVFT